VQGNRSGRQSKKKSVSQPPPNHGVTGNKVKQQGDRVCSHRGTAGQNANWGILTHVKEQPLVASVGDREGVRKRWRQEKTSIFR